MSATIQQRRFVSRQTIVIDPVTRIEGHSKITLHLDDDGRVEELAFTSPSFAASKNSAKAARSMRCHR